MTIPDKPPCSASQELRRLADWWEDDLYMYSNTDQAVWRAAIDNARTRADELET